MTSSVWPLTAALVLVAISFAIGVWARRFATTTERFFGATGLFGPLVVGLSTMAAVSSAFALVGVPGLICRSGNTILLWMLSTPAVAFAFLILGKRVRAVAEIGRVASLGDIVELRFGRHPGIKLCMSLLLMLGGAAYLSAQIKAVAVMFGHVLGWAPWLAAVGVFAAIIGYTVIAGEVGGVLTQAFQGLVLVIASVAVGIFFWSETGGFGAVSAAVDASPDFQSAMLEAWGTAPGAVALAWVFTPAIGTLCQPQVLTRMYVVADPTHFPRLSLISCIAQLFVAGMVLVTGYGALHLLATGAIGPLTEPDLAAYAFADSGGALTRVFFYAAVLAAAMSTSSLFLNLVATTVAHDLLGERTRDPIALGRIAIVTIGVLAMALALFSGEAVAILGTFGVGTFMSATLPGVVLGLLWKGTTARGAFAGLAVGLVLNLVGLVTHAVGLAWPGELPWYVLASGVVVATTIGASLCTTRPILDRRLEAALDL